MSNSSRNAPGVSAVGLLGVVFVTLKLCGVIGWSWWWVTCPFWGPPAVLVPPLAIGGIAVLVAATGRRRRRK